MTLILALDPASFPQNPMAVVYILFTSSSNQGFWEKQDLYGDLTKDWGGLGVHQNVSVRVGCEPWGSRGLRPPPKWSIAGRALVATIDGLTSIRKSSVGLPSWKCLDPKKFMPGQYGRHWRIARVKVLVQYGPVF